MTDLSSILSLEAFPPIPLAGKITIAESHSELHSVASSPSAPATGRGFCPSLVHYTALDGHQLTSRLPYKIPSIRVASKQNYLVSAPQSIPKALWDAYREEGLSGIHNCLLSTDKSTAQLTPAVKTLLKILGVTTGLCVQISSAPSRFLGYLFPHLHWKIEEVNEEFSKVRRWSESWVRALSWHLSEPYLALAINDDSVRICIVGKDTVPMLRSSQQKNVSCLSWRPVVSNELAVGCEDGILIWYLTSTMSLKPGKDQSQLIRVPGHHPVTSVQYSDCGLHFLSSSAKDSSVYLWDACGWSKAPMWRFGSGGIPLALWSPPGNRILCASPSKKCWIWENKQSWTGRRWDTPQGKIEAACWHPDGNILLFASGGCLYALHFQLNAVDQFVAQTDALVKLVFNVEESHKLDEDGDLAYLVGGKVRDMVWDGSGHRVAVLFDNADVIAVFRVLGGSRRELLAPLGFIRGHPEESPVGMAFQREFEEGALLTIAWSSGRIQYFPMIFALPSTSKNILHEDHYRTQQVIHGQPSFSSAGFVSPRKSASGMEPTSPHISTLFGRQEEEAASKSRLYSVAPEGEEED